MNKKKPEPLYSQPPQKVCPVCGEPSYSRDGIHPQCAVKQADAKRVKEEKTSDEGTPIKKKKP